MSTEKVNNKELTLNPIKLLSNKFKTILIAAGVVMLYKLYNKLNELGLIDKFYNYVQQLFINLNTTFDLVNNQCLTRDNITELKKLAKCIYTYI